MLDSIKILFFGLMAMISCQSQVEPQNQQVKYFDMKQFIQTETADLEAQNFGLKKIMQTNNTNDTLVISKPDWKNELNIFSSCNINKPTLYGTYTIDTIAKTVHYQSIAKKNKVQSCMLIFKDDNLKVIEKIEIINRKENFINQSSETLTYEPKQGYTIEIQQNVISAKGSSFILLGEIESVNN